MKNSPKAPRTVVIGGIEIPVTDVRAGFLATPPGRPGADGARVVASLFDRFREKDSGIVSPDEDIMLQAAQNAELGPRTVGAEDDDWSQLGDKPVVEDPKPGP